MIQAPFEAKRCSNAGIASPVSASERDSIRTVVVPESKAQPVASDAQHVQPLCTVSSVVHQVFGLRDSMEDFYLTLPHPEFHKSVSLQDDGRRRGYWAVC